MKTYKDYLIDFDNNIILICGKSMVYEDCAYPISNYTNQLVKHLYTKIGEYRND